MGNMIIVMGPKHAGKTSAGRVLADLLGTRFIDLDVWLEARTGKPPRTLYRESIGLFRQAEAASLHAALETGAGAVIAAGGGLIDNSRALALLQGRESLTLVYLEISPETAWNRIAQNAAGELPPFLDPGNPQEAHRLLHERRAGAYKALAHLCISGESRTPQAVGRAIEEALLNRGKSPTVNSLRGDRGA
ncbi:MAG: AAA family ATPase [Treponema sp.]|jgi:shikimate kinase|nr:AAA family ATPase [Treponema sp.]